MSARSLWDELLKERWLALARWVDENRSEGVHLDFKTTSGLVENNLEADDRKNLAKSMSAFGNTEGGVFIFGAATKRIDKADVLVGLPGVRDPARYATRLGNFIRSMTTPELSGVDIQVIDDTATGTSVVAVYVPETDAGPFRASNAPSDVVDRYYMRSTSESFPVPHQVLGAMFGRRPHPLLRLGFRRQGTARAVNVYVENVGRGTARLPLIRVRVDRGNDTDELNQSHQTPWVDARHEINLRGHGPVWHAAFHLPIEHRVYPGDRRAIGTLAFVRPNPTIHVRIDCDDAPPSMSEQMVQIDPESPDPTWMDPR